MLQIGAALQQARRERGLELAEVAAAMMVRGKYLAALEAERFEEFPAGAYARSFLREYADFLGLEPRLLLEEFDARLGEREPPALVTVPQHRERRPRWGLLVLLACALGTALIAWHESSGRRPVSPASSHRVVPAVVKSAPHTKAPTVRPTSHARVKPRPAAGAPQLVLRANGGPCWISVHAGSASGALLYEGTLQPARSLRLARRQLWVRIGAPSHLELRLDGRTLTLPPSSRPLDVIITKAGLQVL